MATVEFCEGCGRQTDRTYPIPLPVHIAVEKFRGLNGHSDNEGNPVSGRNVNINLCRKCHNTVCDVTCRQVMNIRTIAKKQGVDLPPLPESEDVKWEPKKVDWGNK